jgi:putrescine aminotransferase
MAALSLMDRDEYRRNFQPLVPNLSAVPFGDLESLEAALRSRDVAGFVFEPIQGEAGMIVPPAGYLTGARELCRRFGTLMIADEIQTGLGRTGRMFAVERENCIPDVLLLGKALGGGVAAISALLTTNDIYDRASSATPRSPLHNPTFGGNARSCTAALGTLEIITAENLASRADTSGDYLMRRLRELQATTPLIAAVRGHGLMIGVEFASATKGLASVLTAGVLNRLSNQFLSGIVVMELRRRHGIMTAFTINNPNVLRLQPPLNIEKGDLDRCVAALAETLHEIRSFPHAALSAWRELRRAGGPDTE